jgi:hypothetical protein
MAMIHFIEMTPEIYGLPVDPDLGANTSRLTEFPGSWPHTRAALVSHHRRAF